MWLDFSQKWAKFATLDVSQQKAFSFRGASPPDPHQGLCPWTSLGAPPPDPRYRLALPRSPYAPAPPQMKSCVRPCSTALIAYLLSYRTPRCRCAAQRWMPAAGVVDGRDAKTSGRVTSTSLTSLQACRVSPHPPPGSAEPPRTSKHRRLDAARSAAEVIINVVIVVNTNTITTVILTLVLWSTYKN